MKKTLFCSFAFAVLLVACNKEIAVEEGKSGVEKGEMVELTFHAEITKTSLNADRSVAFTAGEKIAVFANGNKYFFETEEGGTNAVFTGTVDASDASADTFYAISASSSCLNNVTMEGGTFTNVVISKGSEWVTPGKYASAKAVAVAVTTGSSFEFKQACALLKFSVPADVTNLKEVVVFNRDTDLAGSLSGTCSITPNAGSAPTVTATTAEGNPHQTGAAYTNNDVFPSGTYYIPVFPVNLTRGMDLKNNFIEDDNTSTSRRIVLSAVMQLEPGKVYNLGEVRKANRFLCNSFENNNFNAEYTGNTRSGASVLSIVENPLKSTSSVNTSNYVMVNDMAGWSTGTSGYWQSGAAFSNKFNSSVRGSFVTVRMKMYWGADNYYPRFLYNKSSSDNARPARVNGVAITDQASFDNARHTDDWNVLEWDASQFSSKTSFSDLSSFQMRMFIDWGNNTLNCDGTNYHHVAYIDDIEFL